jgi:predicted dehydrogenase
LGVGWIGRHRMESLAAAGNAQIVAVADAGIPVREATGHLAPNAVRVGHLDDLLELDLDAVVIATPSALHAEQSIRALERGLHVFCQKPLGRTAEETQRVIDAARAADRSIGVDFSYRHTAALSRLREEIQEGALGSIFALELVFHNACGPDKPWFYDPRLSGGGCVIDLGVHLVDAALWLLSFPGVADVSSRLYAQGERLGNDPAVVEDFATIRIDLDTGASAQLSCSWCPAAGQDAIIGVRAYGTKGGIAFKNVDGSFYDFVAERLDGTRRTLLVEPPDEWGGRALVAWVEGLGRERGFYTEAQHIVTVARVLDRIYGRGVPNPAGTSAASAVASAASSS